MSVRKLPRFSRLEKIVGVVGLERIKSKCVLVLGCGGVGGYVVESLVRSGVGKLILIDYDEVNVSNINRQIIALESTVGRKKIEVLEERIKQINEECQVIKIDKRIIEDDVLELFQYSFDYFVDACDTVSTKKRVIKECVKRKILFISCMGMGNRLDPSKIEITDIRKTNNDPLARILRKFVKDEKINGKILVASSSEVPVKTGDRVIGSTSFVPAAAGIMIAGYIIREFLSS